MQIISAVCNIYGIPRFKSILILEDSDSTYVIFFVQNMSHTWICILPGIFFFVYYGNWSYSVWGGFFHQDNLKGAINW